MISKTPLVDNAINQLMGWISNSKRVIWDICDMSAAKEKDKDKEKGRSAHFRKIQALKTKIQADRNSEERE